MAKPRTRVVEPGPGEPQASLEFPHSFAGAALVSIALLAGCASPHPAPIVHRAPPSRAEVPVFTAPAPTAKAGETPGGAAPGSVAGAGATTPGGTDAPGATVETVPIPRSTVESRPLPGVGGSLAAAQPSLLKTEPKVVKQPYSDAAFAQMKSANSASDAPPPVALAPPTAPAVPPPTAPARAEPATPANSAASTDAFVWPINGEVVQKFAQPRSMGMLIAGKPGDPIVAVADGRVIFSGPGPRTYGNLVIVKHADETMSVYGNNRALLVKEGQSVKRGQRIAELGSSGTAAPQLRFEIRKDGKPVDPTRYLPER